jgi:hypothetical protein
VPMMEFNHTNFLLDFKNVMIYTLEKDTRSLSLIPKSVMRNDLSDLAGSLGLRRRFHFHQALSHVSSHAPGIPSSGCSIISQNSPAN